MSRFLEKYGSGRRLGKGSIPALPTGVYLPEVSGFLERYHGCDFGHGIYRVHDSESIDIASLVLDMYPAWNGSFLVFAFDWLGRQFALDTSVIASGGTPQVMIMEPGTGEVLQTPCSFGEFHEEELVYEDEAALAKDFFEEWQKTSPGEMGWDTCAGYKVPLFLGGADNVENLEVSNMDVYWTLCSQLWSQLS